MVSSFNFRLLVQCGGGLVYKSLQQLIQNTKDGKKSIGAILVEDESNVSRHLKQCILEQNLQMMVSVTFIQNVLKDMKIRYIYISSASLLPCLYWSSSTLILLQTANWIINCLFSGKLLPFKKNKYASFHRIKMPTFPQDQTVEMSQEI